MACITDKIKTVLIALMFLCISLTETINADSVTFGFGGGALYNGFGTNFGFSSDSTLKYIAVGCIFTHFERLSGDVHESGDTADCGPGLGFVTTRFDTGSNKHGLGVGFGLINDGAIDGIDNEKNERHFRFTYNYFVKGINKRGINFGVAPVYTFVNQNNHSSWLLNIGYQF